MALLDLPFPAHVEQRAPYASTGYPAGNTTTDSSIGSSSGSSGALDNHHHHHAAGARDSFGSSRGEMQTTSLSASASSGSLAGPPGLPRNSSTAELVALGFDPSGGVENNDLNSSDSGGGGGGGGGGFDARPPVPTLSNNGSGAGGSHEGGGGGGGGEMGGSGGGGTGTGSAGGMGLGLRNHSLTNLANMVRSQSVSSFHSDIFAAGSSAARSTTVETPAWGSYPANLDKMDGGGGGGGDMFVSPSMGPRGPHRGIAPTRSLADRGGGGGDSSGADLSPQQFTGRGTAARREVMERSGQPPPSLARGSQRRLKGGGGGGSSFDPRGIPSGPGGGAPTGGGGRTMVHNRSDTDLVASFSRLGFGQGGVSRWSPLMSPTASPLVGAPLLEEDPLDLELEGDAHGGSGGGTADTFGAPSSFLTSHGRRGIMDGGGGGGGGGHIGGGGGGSAGDGMEVRLPRHASYPSLAMSRGGGGSGGGGYGMEDLVHGALEHLTAGDSATVGSGEEGGCK